MEKLFRLLVVSSIVILVVMWTIPYIDYMWLSEDELKLLDANGYGAYIPNGPLVYWGLFVVWLLLSIGLFFYSNMARIVFFVLIITTSMMEFFWGVRVFMSYEIMLNNTIAMLDGAIIAIMYLTSVRNKFIE